MKIVVLTTKTDHHLYFVEKLKKKYKNLFTVIEKKKIRFSFRTKHKFIKQRSIFEKKFFFSNKPVNFKDYKSFYDINDVASIEHIKKINPDIIISFGVGLIKKKFFQQFKKSHIVNLHGGDPENYRGLDSILWSLYHKDHRGLVSTLHYVDQNFDTGNIIFKKNIRIKNDLNIKSIRAYNTINCLYLSNKFLKIIKKKNKVKSYKQKKIGRYYSAISSPLIDIAIKNLKILKKNFNDK